MLEKKEGLPPEQKESRGGGLPSQRERITLSLCSLKKEEAEKKERGIRPSTFSFKRCPPREGS